jgi:hypothetical protein
VDELSAVNLDARIAHAISRTARIEAFLARFPPPDPNQAELLPPISWEQIARQLRSLAGADFERAPCEVEVLRASARTEPPEMFYRELLTLAWSLIDGAKPSRATEAAMD